MKEEKLKGSMIEGYERWLVEEEKSRATVEKYVRSVSHFVARRAEDRQGAGDGVQGRAGKNLRGDQRQRHPGRGQRISALLGAEPLLRQAVPGAEIPVLSRGKGTEPGGVRAAGESDERKAK